MQSADTCDWYTPVLEKQLCWYFECIKEILLAMLEGRKEEDDKDGLHFWVSFKTPQQTHKRECIQMKFDVLPNKTKVFAYLHDYYFTGSLPKYRFVTRAPDPANTDRLRTIGCGF